MTNRFTEWIRGISCALLLILLAVCGYIGSQSSESRAVSVDVTRRTIAWETAEESALSAETRLETERNQEIELLRQVAQSADATDETKREALAQMTEIAQRMEYEAQTTACLTQMGFENAAAVCGAQMMTVILPYGAIGDESEKTRLIDAVCSLTGFSAGDIKIILTKK